MADDEEIKWVPDHPLLKSPYAPFETPAVVRMHRAGWPGPAILKALGMKASQLMMALSKGMDEEQKAHRADRPIHDATVKKGTK